MDFAESFDYVVVGAGAAGAIVARRLAEDPSVSVCLLSPGTRTVLQALQEAAAEIYGTPPSPQA